jgi:hypothetical protein
MTHIAYATADDASRLPFKDRRTSLKVVGVILIVLGAMAGCFSALTPVAIYVAAQAQASAQAAAQRAAPPGTTTTTMVPVAGADVRSMVMAVVFYAVAAAVQIWVGIGAVRIRRWSRPVMLVICYTWLVTGVMGIVFWLAATPNYQQVMTAGMPPNAPQPPRALVYAIMGFTVALMSVFMVAIPGLFAWLFQRKGVQETLDYFDNRVAWTDRCPTPVLAVSGWLLLSAVSFLSYLAFGVLPFFGTMLSGPVAIAGLLAWAALLVLLAWLVYRLRPAGWWGTAVAMTLLCVSTIFTFSRVGWDEVYRKAGYSERDIDVLMRFGGSSPLWTVIFVALFNVFLIVYLLKVRKYFTGASDPQAPQEDAPQAAGAALRV